MNSDDAVLQVIRALDVIGVQHMVTGSFASNLHGIPRSTNDADFVLETSAFDFASLRTALGPGFWLDPQVSFETITATQKYIIHKIAGEPFTIELFFLSDDPHDQKRFARREKNTVVGQSTFVATAEDVIITKLRWSNLGNRAKDLEDVKGVVLVQREHLDWPYIEKWCDLHGTLELLNQVRTNLPR